MQALIIPDSQPRRVEFVGDYPEPISRPGEVLIRVHLAGICATDLELARGYMNFSGVPGHEFVGTVVRGSDRLQDRRVVAEINCACGRCDLCRRGLGKHCPQRSVLGIAGRDGAFAEYLTIPEQNCHIVPDGISDQQATFVEPLAAALHILDAVAIDRQTRVALLGTGRLGLLAAQVLALRPCDLTVIGRNPTTLALCQRLGLRTTSVNDLESAGGYDVIVDCTGCPDGLRLAMRLCRPCGTIVLKSTYAAPATLDLAPLVINETRVIGNRCGQFSEALRLLAARQVQVDGLVSAVYPLHRGVEALRVAASDETIKVLLRPGSD